MLSQCLYVVSHFLAVMLIVGFILMLLVTQFELCSHQQRQPAK